jgi:hypothetical protein
MNWDRIALHVIEPLLARPAPDPQFSDAVLQARVAANKDPDGHALAQTLAAIGQAIVARAPTASTKSSGDIYSLPK